MDFIREKAHGGLRESLRNELLFLRNAIVLKVFYRKKGILISSQMPTIESPDEYLKYYEAICELNPPQQSIFKRAWNIITDFIKRI